MYLIREQRRVVRSITTALAIKPFIILAGVSGSGKTQLARRLAAGVAAGRRVNGVYTHQLPEDLAGADALMSMVATSGVAPALADADDEAFIDIAELQRFDSDQATETHDRAESSYEDVFRNRVAFLPVRPDWKDARDMWGSYNPLTGLFYPTRALRVMVHALMDFARYGDRAGRHFLILDEMNLARVEYFMSDLLSLMESGAYQGDDGRIYLGELVDIHPFPQPIWCESAPYLASERRTSQEHTFLGRMDVGWLQVMALLCRGVSNASFEPLDFTLSMVHTGASWWRLVPPRLAFPPNLTVIGTVNVDETTFALSPKVLDRAFVVEFGHMDFDGVCGDWPGYDAVRHEIQKLHEILSNAGHPFGYRVVKELLEYLEASGRTWETEGDFLIASKLLPKVRGTEEQMEVGLTHLLAYTLGAEVVRVATLVERDPFPLSLEALLLHLGLPLGEVAHPRSARRVLQMLRELRYSGVTSFM